MLWRTRRRRATIFIAAVGVLSLVAAGCSDDNGGETGSDGTVEVTLPMRSGADANRGAER